MEYKDCSTIFSIVPYEINETKPGIYPGHFKIPACLDEEKPERLFIPQPSNHLMMVGGKKTPVVIPTASYLVAEAIVKDFQDLQIFARPDAKPGLVALQGEVSLTDFMVKHSNLHKEMKDSQKRWFMEVIKETDIDWQKTHNLRCAGFIAKYAAKKLGLDKDWNRDEIVGMEFIDCPACRRKVHPEAVVCEFCRCIVNAEKHKTLKFA